MTTSPHIVEGSLDDAPFHQPPAPRNMSFPASAKAERPPSPPTSNDGDFDLSAVQEHIASLNQPIEYVEEAGYGGPMDQNLAYYSTEGGFHQPSNPATPPATNFDNLMRTRSGRAIGSPLTNEYPETSRRSKSPPPKKRRQPKNTSKKSVELTEPLSFFTKDWDIPLGDTATKVNRSSEQRHEEIHSKKNNGKIPRPMNSFMLYRSAYAERVKAYCKEGNHQIISQVTGASWALEPKEVKEEYEKYADLDRQNHAKAHPQYKFTPNKNGPASKKRRERDEDLDVSDWEDQEYDAGRGVRSRSKRSRYAASAESRSRSSTPFDDPRAMAYSTIAPTQYVHPSSYQVSNPRSVSPAYLQHVDNHYYEQWVSPYANSVEDVHVRNVQHPGYGMMEDKSLVGLPTESYPDPTQLGMGGYLDPRLASNNMNSRQQYAVAGPQHYGYGPPQSQSIEHYDYSPSIHPGMATLTSPRAAPYGEGIPGAAFDEELTKWSGQ